MASLPSAPAPRLKSSVLAGVEGVEPVLKEIANCVWSVPRVCGPVVWRSAKDAFFVVGEVATADQKEIGPGPFYRLG